VIGDFNGDNQADVVIEGHGADYAVGVALMTEGTEVRVVEHHQRRDLPPHPATYSEGFGEVVRFISPGTYDIGIEDLPLQLETDAFEVVILEKAATIVYWRDGEFHQWISAD
jgi:hypothetical protein